MIASASAATNVNGSTFAASRRIHQVAAPEVRYVLTQGRRPPLCWNRDRRDPSPTTGLARNAAATRVPPRGAVSWSDCSVARSTGGLWGVVAGKATTELVSVARLGSLVLGGARKSKELGCWRRRWKVRSIQLTIATRSSWRVAQMLRSRTFFCSGAKKDSMAELSGRADLPHGADHLVAVQGADDSRDQNCDSRSVCRMSRIRAAVPSEGPGCRSRWSVRLVGCGV